MTAGEGTVAGPEERHSALRDSGAAPAHQRAAEEPAESPVDEKLTEPAPEPALEAEPEPETAEPETAEPEPAEPELVAEPAPAVEEKTEPVEEKAAEKKDELPSLRPAAPVKNQAAPVKDQVEDEKAEKAEKQEAEDEDEEAKEEDDGWGHFAPVEKRPPGLVRRVLAGFGRGLVHEWTAVSVFGVLLAVVMTWPTAAHLSTTIPNDIYDPLLQTWQVAWNGHALVTNPLHLWDANAFYPSSDSLAFSDSLLGYAPIALLGGGPVAALVHYNILFILAYTLAFVGMYALCRQLGTRWPGAAMAGAAFAYSPWRLAHGGHLNILSAGGIPLALAMLARGHGFTLRRRAVVTVDDEDGAPDGESLARTVTRPGGFDPKRARWGWALGGWLVAAWQITLSWGLGLPFCYLLAGTGVVSLVVLVVRWLARRGKRFPLSLLLGNLGGLLVFGVTCVYMGLPYLRAVNANPGARRSVADLQLFSPPWQGFLIAPDQSWLWGDIHAKAREALPFQPEMTLLVGLVLLGFALVGLFLSVWHARVRLLLAVGVAVSVVLAMGTRFPPGGKYTYLELFHYLPAWDSMRTPGRLVLWTTLLLGLLAAGAVSAWQERAAEVALSRGRNPRRLGLPLRLALVLPLVLVLIEGWSRTPHPVVPTEPSVMREVRGPVLVLPTADLSDQAYMYWSTDGFPKLVNGYSGVEPASLTRTRTVTQSFPDEQSVSYLKGLGVRTVVVLRDQIANTPWQNAATAPVDDLNVQRRDLGDAVIFTIE